MMTSSPPLGNTSLSAQHWNTVLEACQGIVAFAGLVGNILVVITLVRRQYASKFTGAVFLHQTLMDLVVCLVSILVIVQPQNKQPRDSGIFTGNATKVTEEATHMVMLKSLACYAWSSQLIYWYFVFLSVQNLILVAADRYWAVFKPIRYKTLTTANVVMCIFFLHLYSLLVNIADIFRVYYNRANQTCDDQTHLFPGEASTFFFKCYGFLWFLLSYLIPVVAVLVIYSIIVFQLTRVNVSTGMTSKNSQRAATELTKCAVVITIIFIVCFSYDSIFYLLGNMEVLEYQFNTPQQTLGVFLVALNSCVNPLVYCSLMKSFRSRMGSAVCCCLLQTKEENLHITMKSVGLSTSNKYTPVSRTTILNNQSQSLTPSRQPLCGVPEQDPSPEESGCDGDCPDHCIQNNMQNSN